MCDSGPSHILESPGRHKHHSKLSVRNGRHENSKLYRQVKATHVEQKLSPGETRTSTTYYIRTYKGKLVQHSAHPTTEVLV